MDKNVHKYKKWKKCIGLAMATLLFAMTLPMNVEAYNLQRVVNDPLYRYQWALHNDGTTSYTDSITGRTYEAVYGVDAKVENAWNYLGNYYNSKKVIVAVIDTGVDYTHPDLQGKIWTNSGEIANDGIDNDGNGFIDDVYGWNFYDNNNQVYSLEKGPDGYYDNHGTHCAGSIVAEQNNGIGVAGIASKLNVQVMIVQALGGSQGTERVYGRKSSVVQAVEYAEMMGADICNLSIGSYSENRELTEVMQQSDMLFVCACGNDGKDTDRYPVYPASAVYDNVIAVADGTPIGTLSGYSNYGANTVSVVAPGTKIAGLGVNNDYIYSSGTSMAAPIVSGIAALLYAYRPGITADAAKQVLINSATKYDPLNSKSSSGGMINAYQALAYDFYLPEIMAELVSEQGVAIVSISVSTYSGTEAEQILWAEGSHKYEYFANGTKGNLITDGTFTINRTGTYTIYAKNKNGLQSVKTITCTVGYSPKIKTTVSKGKKRSNRIIKVKVTDKDKDIKSVFYASGSHSKSKFSNGEVGKKVRLNKKGKVAITGKKNKTYTVYVIDRSGNETLKKVKCK